MPLNTVSKRAPKHRICGFLNLCWLQDPASWSPRAGRIRRDGLVAARAVGHDLVLLAQELPERHADLPDARAPDQNTLKCAATEPKHY